MLATSVVPINEKEQIYSGTIIVHSMHIQENHFKM